MEIIERVVEKLGPLIRNEVELHLNSDKEAATLASNLKQIQLLLDEAERRQLRDRLVKGWLEELRTTAYDVEDALDDWELENSQLQQQLKEEEEDEQKRNANMSLWEKVRGSPYWCFDKIVEFSHCPCSSFKKVVQHRNIALNVKGLNEKIEKIYKEGVDQLQLNQLLTSVDRTESEGSGSNHWRKTTSDFIKSRVHGREDDKANIKKILLQPDDALEHNGGSEEDCRDLVRDSDKIVSPDHEVICIVGQGGLGKTTLAKMVYDDEDVKREFEERMWVCVSDPFDELAIARDIYEGLEGCSPNVSGLEAIKKKIRESLERKSKFLLVLDDVWTEDPTEWESLEACLSHGAERSKILVTTRKEKTAEAVGAAKRSYSLQKMDDEYCWSIIRQTALLENKGNYHSGLEKVGRQIAKKCDGLPLAAKVLGGLLKGKRNAEDWRRVLESEIWELKDVEENLFRHFFLSYDELKPEVKRCFSYCAVFPKDYEIEVEDLIRLWMAQGFLASSSASKSEEMEERGYEYFEELAHRSFFQDIARKDTIIGERLISCKMHDIVHDFAKYLSGNECVAVQDAKRLSETARHLSWLPGEKLEATNWGTESSVEKLRSLVGFRGFPIGVVGNLKRARALHLADCELDVIPEDIGNLMHLRYLNLKENSSIREIPETICNLHCLQTLDLRGYSSISRLPSGISKLINLRHILVDELAWDFMYTPEIARLTNLQTLVRFDAGKEVNDLTSLQHLNLLRGTLEIRLRDDLRDEEAVNAAKMAGLSQKKFLQALLLEYDNGVESQVIEALRPNPELSCLSIDNRSHSTYPSWLATMENLRYLFIGFKVETAYSSLPPLWKLPFLETLVIEGHYGMQYVGNGFYGLVSSAITSTDATNATTNQVSEDDNQKRIVAFPALRKLQLGDDRNSKYWDDMTDEEEELIRSHNITIMPLLTEIFIDDCWFLSSLPERTLLELPSLQTLRIGNNNQLFESDLSRSTLSRHLSIVFMY